MWSKELNKLVKVRSEYVVQYSNSWFENNEYFIEMELCSDNLKNILRLKRQVFAKKSEEAMNCVEYFVSCHIFREILECVQNIHERNPPVIHGDLKPDNILLARKVRNGRYFKIGDFGLATVNTTHTSSAGNVRYRAPEVDLGEGYDHKVDIFSLSVIGFEIFDGELYSNNEM
jgi:serine/threonine protein kinase